jgi:hypothetical protein
MKSMSKTTLYLWIIVVLSCCMRSKRDDLVIIRWGGGSKMEDVKWSVNDKNVGVGLHGCGEVLKALNGCKDRSYIKVFYPVALWNENVPGYNLHDPMPFGEHADLRKEFERTMAAKLLTLEEIAEK